MTRTKGDLNEIDTRPLTPSERAHFRRMLPHLDRIVQDEHYKQRRKTTVRVWLTTLVTFGSIVVAAVTLWRDVIAKVWP
jgi:hypothetical protein